MNQFAPDWNRNMGDAFTPLGGEDDGLMELLWCNGNVVMQSQAPPRKSPRPERAVQDDEVASWFQYPVVEDPLERDLFSEFFGMTAAAAGTVCKQEEGCGAAPQSGELMMSSPREKESPRDAAAANTAAGGEGTPAATETGDSSALTVGSSICGSNHVQTPRAGVPDDGAPPPGSGKARDATTVTSSTSSLRPTSCDAKTVPPGAASHRSAAGNKRKQHGGDAAPTRCDDASQDVEFESDAVTCETALKATTGKRRRAAEVHNLSERRRRDRINEKMKALQELIPHCNKTDKASMLDEAIEYLKSLQLQLQMMWMGGGMAASAAPVMFPAGAHQYMQRLASMPMMPFMPAAVQSPAVGHHMPVADPYRRYPAADHLQPPSPMHYMQGMMSMYQQQQQSMVPPPIAPGSSVPAPPSDGVLHKRYETCGKPDIKGMNS